ncbi:hypothetical protein KP509_24G074500 [Ceratopteris richardii]|uniref:C2 domain-containing protein n=1 Tax=Ceratopteris richardii TaxID=49495 RepID=A0A8T2RZ43_CERRI|nr:hypothetical protein KP509_24G074500 [Ceratopteris richardii]
MAPRECLLKIRIIECRGLIDRQILGRQDPYIVVDYGGRSYRTGTCKNGGLHPRFNEEFQILISPGAAQSVTLDVFNSNNISADDHIACGTILLHQVLKDRFHDSRWPLMTKNGRRSGEVRVVLELLDHVAHDDINQRPPQYPQGAYPLNASHIPYLHPPPLCSYPTVFPYGGQPQFPYPNAYPYAQPWGFYHPQNTENFAQPSNVYSYPPPSAPPPPTGAQYYPQGGSSFPPA